MASLEYQVTSQNRCYVNSRMCNYGFRLGARECRLRRSGLSGMRLVALLLAWSVVSWADVPPSSRGPSRVIEAQPWEPPARATAKVPGMSGVPAAGIVIETDPGGDARPWPHGSWIKTPDIGDANVLELGTDRLPGLPRSGGLAARLSRGLDAGVGTLLDLVLPPARLVR